MVITSYVDEQYGSSPGTNQAAVANLNVGDVSNYEIVVANFPMTASEHSYEKWFKIRFTGTANKVDNLRVWVSAGSLDAEADLKTNARESSYGGAETYATPVKTTSSIATQEMPTSEPSGANLGIGGSLSGSLTSFPDTSDYLVIQYQTTGSHPAGDIVQVTLEFKWDEQ